MKSPTRLLDIVPHPQANSNHFTDDSRDLVSSPCALQAFSQFRIVVGAGGPGFCVFPSRSGTMGAPSLRSLQGRAAMLPMLLDL